MGSLGWTYEYLSWFVARQRGSSSSSVSVALNPIIKELMVISNSTVYDIGGHSVLIPVKEDIVAKVSIEQRGLRLRHEQTVLKLLNEAPCPFIIQPFFCCADIIFMPLIKNGNLHQRMTMVNKPRHILPWMQQLSDAAAHIESYGYAHGDLNPR